MARVVSNVIHSSIFRPHGKPYLRWERLCLASSADFMGSTKDDLRISHIKRTLLQAPLSLSHYYPPALPSFRREHPRVYFAHRKKRHEHDGCRENLYMMVPHRVISSNPTDSALLTNARPRQEREWGITALITTVITTVWTPADRRLESGKI